MLEIFRWNFIVIQCDFESIRSSQETSVSFYLYIYKIQSFCHLIRSKLERRTNIYLNQLEVNFQPGSRVHQSLFSAAEQKMFLLLLKIFPSLRLSSSQKISIDSLPSKRIFPQTYIYISLSKRGTILKSKRLIARNSKSFFGWRRRTSGVQFLPYLRSSSEQRLLWGEGYLRDFFSQVVGERIKTSTKGHLVHKGNSKEY